MTFSQNASGDWETNATLAGHPITILVDSCFTPEERTSYALAAIAQIETYWEAIEQNLIDSLHKMYNESWAEPDDGFPELTATEFLAKLKLNLVTIMEEPDCLNLYFEDSDLFGGHSIELYWTKDKMYDANIVG
jgi:hypothetical protein